MKRHVNLLLVSLLVASTAAQFPKAPRFLIAAHHPHHNVFRFSENHDYKWRVLPFGVTDLCNSQVCSNGEPHTLCLPQEKPADRCRGFKRLDMDFNVRRRFVMGHNGLRHRVTTMSGWYATNMNILHWDFSLAEMAESFIAQCRVIPDPCDFIYSSDFPVGQNLIFFDRKPTDRWVQKAVVAWFRVYRDTHYADVDNVTVDTRNSFTQFAWAKTQFLGCAGAGMDGGYLVTCFYYPRGNVLGEPVFLRGRDETDGCSQCERDRDVCSEVLEGLCGLDDEYVNGGASVIALSPILMTVGRLLMGDVCTR